MNKWYGPMTRMITEPEFAQAVHDFNTSNIEGSMHPRVVYPTLSLNTSDSGGNKSESIGSVNQSTSDSSLSAENSSGLTLGAPEPSVPGASTSSTAVERASALSVVCLAALGIVVSVAVEYI